jgi:hypothetical protein
MRLALLGADDEAMELARSALLSDTGKGHELVAAFDVQGYEREIREVAPRARLNEDWESLLLGSLADLVIVARGQARVSAATGVSDDDRRAEQLRKLAQAGVPMLVFCPACEAIIGFEIEMIRQDTHSVVLPYLPNFNWECVRRLAGIVALGDDSPIGRVEQLSIEREMADRSRPQVLTQLARDMAIVRQLAGDISRVTASGPPLPVGQDPLGPKSRSLPPLSNLSVHLQGQGGLVARWTVGPVTSDDLARITLSGTEGRATVTLERNGSWTLYLPGDMERHPEVEERGEEPEILHLCEQMLTDNWSPEWDWLDACRDQEVAEAIDRSLLKGRTVELLSEEPTQAGSFKGVMAIGGCLMLFLALLGVLGATLVEGLGLPLRDWAVWQFWPVFLVAPLALFLVLQLLCLAVPAGPDAKMK